MKSLVLMRRLDNPEEDSFSQVKQGQVRFLSSCTCPDRTVTNHEMELRVYPLLRIVDADTNEIINLRDQAVFEAVRHRPVSAFRLEAMPEGLAALEGAPGVLVILAAIGFGRVGKSTMLNALLALTRELQQAAVYHLAWYNIVLSTSRSRTRPPRPGCRRCGPPPLRRK